MLPGPEKKQKNWERDISDMHVQEMGGQKQKWNGRKKYQVLRSLEEVGAAIEQL